ncbi:glycosyltransferase [Neosynechococcus sphagnicola]
MFGIPKEIHGFYRLCDCGILASRFQGESFPLTLIECIQTSTPVIATDVGEVKNIVTFRSDNSLVAGVLVAPEPNDTKFVGNLVSAMYKMLDRENHIAYVNAAKQIQNDFQIDKVTSQYDSVYNSLLERRAVKRVYGEQYNEFVSLLNRGE